MTIPCPACCSPDVPTWWCNSPVEYPTLRYRDHRRPYGPGACRNSGQPVQLTKQLYEQLRAMPDVDERWPPFELRGGAR